MDFALEETQLAVLEAARGLFEGHCTNDRLREVDTQAVQHDAGLWSALAQADLLGLAVPEALGGSGLGLLEVVVLIEEAARASAPVPLLATLIGALTLAELAPDDIQGALLPGVANGSVVLALALAEQGTVDAVAVDGTWTLTGWRSCTWALPVAQHVLVPAAVPGGEGLFLVDLAGGGVTASALDTTSGSPEGRLELAGAGAVRLGGSQAVSWIDERATVALGAAMAGHCEGALRMTAAYTIERKQFDRQIATFQAVGQRLAEAYMDTEAIRLTYRQAAWRLAVGAPAAPAVHVAKFWAADAGQRVVHAAQHLHGGVGVDRSYPLHRHFLAAKQLELSLGGATRSLLRLGQHLAEVPA